MFVKTLTGRTITLKVAASDTVFDVKELIQDAEGVPAHLQRVVFEKKHLDDDREIGEYGVRKDSTLHLSGGLCGGGKKGVEGGESAPTPPFDEHSQPPYKCFFPGCSHTRRSYLKLMDHVTRDHQKGVADFPGTHFAREYRKEKAARWTDYAANKAAQKAGASTAPPQPAAPHAAAAAEGAPRGQPAPAAEAPASAAAAPAAAPAPAAAAAAAVGSAGASGARAKAKAATPPRAGAAAAAEAAEGASAAGAAAAPRHVWIVCINEMWANDHADGLKAMECSTGRGRFSRVRPGDLIILVCSKSGGRVAAVCEASARAKAGSDPNDLRSMVQPTRWQALVDYLSGQPFTFVPMRCAWDVRGLSFAADALIQAIGAQPLPKGWHQFFQSASTDDAVADKLLELISGCRRHDHDAPPASTAAPAQPQPAATAATPPRPSAAPQKASAPFPAAGSGGSAGGAPAAPAGVAGAAGASAASAGGALEGSGGGAASAAGAPEGAAGAGAVSSKCAPGGAASAEGAPAGCGGGVASATTGAPGGAATAESAPAPPSHATLDEASLLASGESAYSCCRCCRPSCSCRAASLAAPAAGAPPSGAPSAMEVDAATSTAGEQPRQLVAASIPRERHPVATADAGLPSEPAPPAPAAKRPRGPPAPAAGSPGTGAVGETDAESDEDVSEDGEGGVSSEPISVVESQGEDGEGAGAGERRRAAPAPARPADSAPAARPAAMPRFTLSAEDNDALQRYMGCRRSGCKHSEKMSRDELKFLVSELRSLQTQRGNAATDRPSFACNFKSVIRRIMAEGSRSQALQRGRSEEQVRNFYTFFIRYRHGPN